MMTIITIIIMINSNDYNRDDKMVFISNKDYSRDSKSESNDSNNNLIYHEIKIFPLSPICLCT